MVLIDPRSVRTCPFELRFAPISPKARSPAWHAVAASAPSLPRGVEDVSLGRHQRVPDGGVEASGVNPAARPDDGRVVEQNGRRLRGLHPIHFSVMHVSTIAVGGRLPHGCIYPTPYLLAYLSLSLSIALNVLLPSVTPRNTAVVAAAAPLAKLN